MIYNSEGESIIYNHETVHEFPLSYTACLSDGKQQRQKQKQKQKQRSSKKKANMERTKLKESFIIVDE